MNLLQKIKFIYPSVVDSDFDTVVLLRDNSDGRGAYIDRWDHPSLPRPTEEQLAALEAK